MTIQPTTTAAPTTVAAAPAPPASSPATSKGLIHEYYARRRNDDDQVREEVRFAINCGLEYARNVARHLGRRLEPWPDLAGLRVLELGPGLNFGPMIVCRAFGAAVTVIDKYLVDWKEGYHPGFYARLKDETQRALPGADWSVLDRIIEAGRHPADDLTAVKCDLGGATPLPSGRFDAVVSNAVLEHVRDVEGMATELARLTTAGGVGIHQVDFRDHGKPERPLDFLTNPEPDFALQFERSKGGAGNRYRHTEMGEYFRRAGFTVIEFAPNCMADAAYVDEVRAKLIPRFAAMPTEDLRIVGGRFYLRRQGVSASASTRSGAGVAAAALAMWPWRRLSRFVRRFTPDGTFGKGAKS